MGMVNRLFRVGKYGKFLTYRKNKMCFICVSHRKNWSGYPLIMLGDKRIRAHRYVFYVVFGRWPKGILRHTCDNRDCINPTHLIEGTRRLNSKDAVVRKRFPTGEDHWMTSLKEEDVLKIFHAKKSLNELAKIYGVCAETISNIKRGKTWSWVTKGHPNEIRNRKNILKEEELIRVIN